MSHDRFIRTEKFHILPIYGVMPDDLKKSSKDYEKDREDIKHNTRLNLLAKTYGVSGGIAGYIKEFEHNLKPFMQAHGLVHQANLITNKNCFYLTLDARQVSDRLFVSGLPMPDKIFTGYNFDYFPYQHGYADFNLPQSPFRLPFYECELAAIYHAEKDPDTMFQFPGRMRSHYEVVMGACMQFLIYESFNFLDDLLIAPTQKCSIIPKKYWVSDYEEERIQDLPTVSNAADQFFRRLIDKSEHGWVSVIPYNDNLIFLKGEGGVYDFVLRNMRTKTFSHQLYAPYLKRSEVPRAMNTLYNFRRWHYFSYNGWAEMDQHRAETYFYAQGRTADTHPEIDKILEEYFVKKGVYAPKSIAYKGSTIPELDFFPIKAGNTRLMVSNLITIQDLMIFSNKKPEYFEARQLIKTTPIPDHLEPMNSDAPHLPATVTWYDACAYIKWLEDEHGLPFRLLKTDEYLAIRGKNQIEPDQAASEDDIFENGTDDPYQRFIDKFFKENTDTPKKKLITFVNDKGKDLGGYPPYMAEQDFQNLKCIYVREPEYIYHDSGLKFVESDDVGEWLFENPYGKEACCIRSLSLGAVNGGECVQRNTQPASSTGKYKYTKVGFRICYEVKG